MSYILDALNKSERERTGAKTPRLGTVHHRAEPVSSDSPQRWPLILTIVLILNLAVLTVWYFKPTGREETPISNLQSYDSSFPSTKIRHFQARRFVIPSKSTEVLHIIASSYHHVIIPS